MPKYVIIGLAIPVLLFIIMHFWGKFNEKTKNRIVALFYINCSCFCFIDIFTNFLIFINTIHRCEKVHIFNNKVITFKEVL